MRVVGACSRAHRSDAIFHVICGVCMRGPVGYCHLRVVLGLLVRIWHHDTDGGAQCDAITNTCKDRFPEQLQQQQQRCILAA